MLTEKNIKNILIYMLPNFCGYIMSLLLMPIMTRLLVPAEYGVIVMAGLFPTIAVGVFSLGLVGATQRNFFVYKNDPKKYNALIGPSQLLLFVMFFITIIPVFFLRKHLGLIFVGDPKYGLAVMIVYISAFFSTIVTFYLSLYQNMERAKEYAVFLVMQAAISSVTGLCYLWFLKISYMGPIFGGLTGSSIVLIILFFRFNREIKFGFDKKVFLDNVSYGLQLVPKSFTGIINRYFDKFMLINMVSLSAVGIYNIGQNIGLVIFNLHTAIWNSFQPVFYSAVFDKGRDASGPVGRLFSVFSPCCYGHSFFQRSDIFSSTSGLLSRNSGYNHFRLRLCCEYFWDIRRDHICIFK